MQCSQLPQNIPKEEPDYYLNNTAYEKSRENSRDLKKLKASYLKQTDELDSMQFVLDIIVKELKKQKNNSITLKSIIEKDLNKIRNEFFLNRDSLDLEFTNSMLKIQNKIKILEDRASYTDSTNFEILNMLVMFENKITALTNSYREISEVKNNGSGGMAEIITDSEYREQYIEGLSAYQNGDYQLSLKYFNYLINVDSNHDLADNCQYWIGEVYYGLKDYKRSIKEFEQVFTFSGTNKDDDSQYKLGLCYINIGNKSRAREEFQKLLDNYSNSEYYKKAKQYMQQL